MGYCHSMESHVGTNIDTVLPAYKVYIYVMQSIFKYEISF